MWVVGAIDSGYVWYTFQMDRKHAACRTYYLKLPRNFVITYGRISGRQAWKRETAVVTQTFLACLTAAADAHKLLSSNMVCCRSLAFIIIIAHTRCSRST